MNEIKEKVIEIFENKNENFKKGLAREFNKTEPKFVNTNLYKYRDILIYNILEEISSTNDILLKNIENPMELIEQILFNHINSNYTL